jgi:hypothetical protein
MRPPTSGAPPPSTTSDHAVVVVYRHNELVNCRDAVIAISRQTKHLSLIVNDAHFPNRDLICSRRYSTSQAKSLFLANYGLSQIPPSRLFFYSELIADAARIVADWEAGHREATNHRMNLPPHQDYVLEFRLFGVLARDFRSCDIYVSDSLLGTNRFFQLLNASRNAQLRITPLNRHLPLGSEAAAPEATLRVTVFSYSFMTDIRYFGAIISALNASKGVRASYVCQRFCYAATFGHDFVPYEAYRPQDSRVPRIGDGADRDPSYAEILSSTQAFQRATFKRFLEAESPDVVVTRDDTRPFINWLDEFRRSKGFKVIHVPHGMDQISRGYEVDPWFADKCALGLPGYDRAVVGSHDATGKAVLTGDLLRPTTDGRAFETVLRQRCAGKKVLLLPSQGFQETRRIIEMVTPVIRAASEYFLLIKRNPFEDFIDYEFDTQDLGKGQVCVTDHRDINALIGISHALITANSTSLLNAIQLGVPVLAFRPLISRTILEEAPGVLRFFETSGEIAAGLGALEKTSSDGGRRAAEDFLRRYFPYSASDAVNNITELVLGEVS